MVSVSGVALLTRRAGINRIKRSSSRGLVASSAIRLFIIEGVVGV